VGNPNIITSQYVRIKQPLAGIGTRIIARIIDSFILALYIIIIILIMKGINIYITHTARTVLILLASLPAFMYNFIFESLLNGQTLGKKIMNIRVTRLDGTQSTIGNYFMRWIMEIVDIHLTSNLAGIVSILATKSQQRLGDLAAGTIVIKNIDYHNYHVSLDEFYWAKKDYTPVYPEAASLSPKQATVIEKTLNTLYYTDHERCEQLAEKVQKFLKIENIKDRNAESFLTTVLHDYQYYLMELV